MVEYVRRHLPVGPLQGPERSLQVGVDDRLDPQFGEGRKVEHPGRLLLLVFPDGPHHQLQQGRRYQAGRLIQRGVGAADLDLVQDGVDQSVLQFDGRVGLSLVVVADGALDGLPGLVAVEEVEVQVVAVDVGDEAGEEVTEPGVHVLADGDQEVGTHVGAVHTLSQLAGETARLGLPGPVEEVLFELVEDQQQRHAGAVAGRVNGLHQAPAWQRRRVPVAGKGPDARRNEVLQRVDGLVLPHVEDQWEVLGATPSLVPLFRHLEELGGHSGPQQGTLTSAALGVQECQAASPQIGRDRLALGIPAKEPGGIALGIEVEARERAVGERACTVHTGERLVDDRSHVVLCVGDLLLWSCTLRWPT